METGIMEMGVMEMGVMEMGVMEIGVMEIGRETVYMVERERDRTDGQPCCPAGSPTGCPTGRAGMRPATGTLEETHEEAREETHAEDLEVSPGLCLLRLEPAHGRELSAFETRIFHHGWLPSQMEEALSNPGTHWGFGFFLGWEDGPGHGLGKNPGHECGEGGHGDVGSLCAYILMNCALDECEVANIAVREDLRGQGLGGRLLDRALQEARDRHIKTCFLEVASGNPVARSLYVSRGFMEVGQRRGYYSETGDDAIVMRLDL